MSARLCSIVDIKGAADEGQTGSSVYRLPALMGRASVAQGAGSHSTPVKTFALTYKNISILMKAFASPGGNLSDFHQTSFAASHRAIMKKVALVIVAEWQLILQNRIKTALELSVHNRD